MYSLYFSPFGQCELHKWHVSLLNISQLTSVSTDGLVCKMNQSFDYRVIKNNFHTETGSIPIEVTRLSEKLLGRMVNNYAICLCYDSGRYITTVIGLYLSMCVTSRMHSLQVSNIVLLGER